MKVIYIYIYIKRESQFELLYQPWAWRSMIMLDEPLKIVKERWHRQVEVMRSPIYDQQMITGELENSLSWSCWQYPCAKGTHAVWMDKDWFGMTHPMMATPMKMNFSTAHWTGFNYIHSWKLSHFERWNWSKKDTKYHQPIWTQTSTLIRKLSSCFFKS